MRFTFNLHVVSPCCQCMRGVHSPQGLKIPGIGRCGRRHLERPRQEALHYFLKWQLLYNVAIWQIFPSYCRQWKEWNCNTLFTELHAPNRLLLSQSQRLFQSLLRSDDFFLYKWPISFIRWWCILDKALGIETHWPRIPCTVKPCRRPKWANVSLNVELSIPCRSERDIQLLASNTKEDDWVMGYDRMAHSSVSGVFSNR